MKQRQSVKRDVMAWILAMGGLYWFAASFFLAKRSLMHRSSCDEAASLLIDTLGLDPTLVQDLSNRGILASSETVPRSGCWMHRKVDSMVILLVDALRFDFALYNLPNSIGKRLDPAYNHTSSSRLLQFIADPPTVTMQRLKALTTGGLPTFADISANLGGASVDEDSWVPMLKGIDYARRGLSFPGHAGFVGDDTWVDLYPGGFTEAYPYPSFNTRDLNTVDAGCEKHIPELLRRLRRSNKESTSDELELMVVHFLGVDHVGHTYGPHNQHMSDKLAQMDDDLTLILNTLDHADQSCHATLIFGDHGMTEDGNHGGGTEEEIAAALFVHVSKGCSSLQEQHGLEETRRRSELVEAVFGAIHQIDLVPTITTLLGLPIPFANLGGLDPSLLPGFSAEETATALALNAAQVWRYFTAYSETANRLPGLPALESELKSAVSMYAQALSDAQEMSDPDAFVQSATLLKGFLQSALNLGQRVWTRFDSLGMTGGTILLAIGMLILAWPLFVRSRIHDSNKGKAPRRAEMSEVVLAALFILFTCGLCSFSNSYILEEEQSVLYCLSILCISIALRLRSVSPDGFMWKATLLLPLLSRTAELAISGHGLDPSIPLHLAHHSAVFLTSLAFIAFFRYLLFQYRILESPIHLVADEVSLIFLALSWWEKRLPDSELNGYFFCRIEIAVLVGSLLLALIEATTNSTASVKNPATTLLHQGSKYTLTLLFKIAVAIMTVTGPAAAASFLFFLIQVTVLFALSAGVGTAQVASVVIATLLRLTTRHGKLDQ